MKGNPVQQGYFSRSWNAIRTTDNWIGKTCLLALITLIPLFGAIVVSGYLLGWARDAAWGMDNPLPKHIFGNEDGRLYRRGFFSWVICIVMGLIVSATLFVCMALFGLTAGLLQSMPGDMYALPFLTLPATIGSFGIGAAFVVMSFGAQFFIWVGLMRMSIYDTLSSGFQFSQIWEMIRRDPAGLLWVFLYEFVAMMALGFVLSVVWVVVVLIVAFGAMCFAGAVDLSGVAPYGFEALASIGLVVTVLFFLAVVYASLVTSVIVQALVYRSLGYWTAQFNVPAWGSQYDLLPDVGLRA